MSELSIRREMNIAARFEKLSQTERRAAAGTQGTGKANQVARAAGRGLSESLQRLLAQGGLTAGAAQSGRQMLRMGEGALAEAQDLLRQMEDLAQKATEDGADRTALQSEMTKLLDELDRMLDSASWDGTPLFRSEDGEAYRSLVDGLEKMLSTLLPLSEDGDMSAVTDGLERVLAQAARGVPVEQALQELMSGSLAAQMEAGQTQDLMDLLMNLLSGDAASALAGAGLPAELLSCSGATGLDLLMNALAGLNAGGEAAQRAESAPPQPQTMELGGLQVSGRDLSGVSFDEGANLLVISGEGNVTVTMVPQAGQTAPGILVAGSGEITLKNVDAARLLVRGDGARISTAGENVLGEVRLERGASVTLGGSGTLEAAAFRGDAASRVTLAGGAVTVDEGRGRIGNGTEVVVESAASLLAVPQEVRTADGGRAEPFDVVWKALLPGWKSVTALEADGRQLPMSLIRSETQDEALRLWLARGNSRENPIHTVTVRGRDQEDQPTVRTVWVRWDEERGVFVPVVMYPNPFTVTGGSPGADWRYDEDTQTLTVLTEQVTAVSGGAGLDAEQNGFSGRLAVEDNLGWLQLTLEGVDCRVKSGGAFRMGRENHVTLLLADGARNFFESGPGFAGLSLGEGAELTIDRAPAPEEDGDEDGPEAGTARKDDEEEPEPGVLTAVGGEGGAGIGRDSGGTWDRVAAIFIHGGEITARGAGGGAGIGAGKHAFLGDITITGGQVTAEGGPGGGAGIGGALGGPVGDITITGGTISASAVYHAAAIGAGVEGECGDVTVGALARILKAKGGDPETSIGPCRFGKCGQVNLGNRTAAEAVLGAAQFPRQMEDPTASLPKFVIDPRILRLKNLDLSTLEDAWAAQGTIANADRHLSLIRGIYQALSGQMEADGGTAGGALIRDAGAAGALLEASRAALGDHPARAMLDRGGQGKEHVLHLLQRD